MILYILCNADAAQFVLNVFNALQTTLFIFYSLAVVLLGMSSHSLRRSHFSDLEAHLHLYFGPLRRSGPFFNLGRALMKCETHLQ